MHRCVNRKGWSLYGVMAASGVSFRGAVSYWPDPVPKLESLVQMEAFMKHMMRLALMLLVLVGLLVGCGQAADDGGAAAPAGDAAFKVTGMVDSELAMTEDDVKAMDTVYVDFTNKDGETDRKSVV